MNKRAYLAKKRLNSGKFDLTSRAVPAPYILRRCYVCKEIKSLEEFVKDKTKSEGFGYRCIKCNILRNRAYRERNAEKENSRRRKYRADNIKIELLKEEFRRKNKKERRHAQYVAQYHTNLGEKCIFCGSNQKLERHHPDYTKPLEFLTVCHRCHLRIHHAGLTVEGV